MTGQGYRIEAATVVLTVGTFLAGRIHIGETGYSGGRAGDAASTDLADRLRDLGLRVGRLKTGTPPRLDGRTIDFDSLEPQPGDSPAPVFSFLGKREQRPPQRECHITHTTEKTHEIIRSALGRSPLYSGAIGGVGPRYCPSIEDKVVRFADRASHQIFVEPEGLDTHEVYPNGISTSLPLDVQHEFVRSITGFERAHITRPGYAIEYDFFDPRDLQPWLETKAIEGLFFAGQINGTTGYEEAAAQGILAGMNAALRVSDRAPWFPRRDQAYIGVLVDDLVTLGTSEPYRMFTSRAEHRLLLREDNADQRLTPLGRELGVVDNVRFAAFEAKVEAIARERSRLETITVKPEGVPETSAYAPLTKDTQALKLLRRPEGSYEKLVSLAQVGRGAGVEGLGSEQAEQVGCCLETEARYAGYIARQERDIERTRRQAELELPRDMRYAEVSGLSNEVREKLDGLRPQTIGQASRIPGVTPAAVSLLLVHLKRQHRAVG